MRRKNTKVSLIFRTVCGVSAQTAIISLPVLINTLLFASASRSAAALAAGCILAPATLLNVALSFGIMWAEISDVAAALKRGATPDT